MFMKRFLIAAMAFLCCTGICFASSKAPKAPKQPDREVVYQTNLHCKSCAAKIQDNIAFEKGVKDLEIQVDEKTVRVVYNPAKTDSQKLAEAIRDLGYTAEIISDKEL